MKTIRKISLQTANDEFNVMSSRFNVTRDFSNQIIMVSSLLLNWMGSLD
jgi:hypothetical protein